MDIKKLVEDVEGLCKRLRYNASIWQRKADDDHPLVKDQLDAANAIDRLACQAQGYCKDAKHAESVADELRRLLEKEKERADKFMWQVRDTCTRAEAAETRSAALARALEEAKGIMRKIAPRLDSAHSYLIAGGCGVPFEDFFALREEVVRAILEPGHEG